MPTPSLNAKNKPSWSLGGFLGKLNPFRSRIEPETYSQSQGISFTKEGLIRPVITKSGRRQVGEINGYGNQFVIERPGAGVPVDPEKALANNKGFVYASVNAKTREVMVIDWRLFSVNGDEHEEETDHELLDRRNHQGARFRERVTLRAAHRRSGMAAADFSRIRYADLKRFTIDRLMGMLSRLGSRIEAKLRVMAATATWGWIKVLCCDFPYR